MKRILPVLSGYRTGVRVFVHTFCLTAQGLDGDPVYLLDEFMCYRLKPFQDGGGFIKVWPAASSSRLPARSPAAVENSESMPQHL